MIIITRVLKEERTLIVSGRSWLMYSNQGMSGARSLRSPTVILLYNLEMFLLASLSKEIYKKKYLIRKLLSLYLCVIITIKDIFSPRLIEEPGWLSTTSNQLKPTQNAMKSSFLNCLSILFSFLVYRESVASLASF